jgi:colicin import membrane protein
MKALNLPAPEDSSEGRGSPESFGPVSERGEVWEELDTERARRERAESTLREGMAEEQRRREEAERERDDLGRELYALREARESPQTVEEEQELDTERARREMAESTLHEGMDEERRRREEAERERDDLRREMFARIEPRESPEAAEEQQGRGEPRPAERGAQETSESLAGRGSGTARGSLWRRLFGR